MNERQAVPDTTNQHANQPRWCTGHNPRDAGPMEKVQFLLGALSRISLNQLKATDYKSVFGQAVNFPGRTTVRCKTPMRHCDVSHPSRRL